MSRPAAIYALVSSDRQKENHTIASQTAALQEYAQKVTRRRFKDYDQENPIFGWIIIIAVALVIYVLTHHH